MKPLLVAAFSLFLISCTPASDEQKSAIKEACKGMTADDIKKIDDISEACKAAIAVLLPSPTNNLNSRLFNLGTDSSTKSHRLIIGGTDAQGAALSTESLRGLELSAVVAGVEQKIPASAYKIAKALDNPAELMSISLIGDYSGSMGDADITRVSELFSDFTQTLTPIANFEVIYFSTEVITQQPLIADSKLLEAALQKNTSIPRASTALYDAIGKATEDLNASSRPGHIMIVGTDGMENSSKKYTKDLVKQALLADKKLLVLIMGTFLSDVKEMQDLAGTRGVFVYAQSLNAGKDTLLAFSKSLRESIVVELADTYESATELKANLGEASVSFKL